MKHQTFYPKCPRCKFTLADTGLNSKMQALYGEYAPESVKVECPMCGFESYVTATRIMKYTARKARPK